MARRLQKASQGDRQSAYSCGGSHGLGPIWVFRTVFPINPLEVIHRGTVTIDLVRARRGRQDMEKRPRGSTGRFNDCPDDGRSRQLRASIGRH